MHLINNKKFGIDKRMPTTDYSNTQRTRRLRELKSLSSASAKSRGARDNTTQMSIKIGGISNKTKTQSGLINYNCGKSLTCVL